MSGWPKERVVASELLPSTTYVARVRAIDGQVLGTPIEREFATLSAEDEAAACRNDAVSSSDEALCDTALRPAIAECINDDVCENGAFRDVTCACVCVGGFSGAQCDLCEHECANGGAARVLGDVCECVCAAGWSGAQCDERVLVDGRMSPAVIGDVTLSARFDQPGPDALRLSEQPLHRRNESVFAFELDALYDGVVDSPDSLSFELTLAGLTPPPGEQPTLLLFDGSEWVNAALTCPTPQSRYLPTGGVLIVRVCHLSSFAILLTGVVGDEPSTIVAITTAPSPEAATDERAVPDDDDDEDDESSGSGGIVAAVVVVMLLLAGGVAIVGGVLWHRKREKAAQVDQVADSYAAELRERRETKRSQREEEI